MTRPPSAALTPLRDALNRLLAVAALVAPRAEPLNGVLARLKRP